MSAPFVGIELTMFVLKVGDTVFKICWNRNVFVANELSLFIVGHTVCSICLNQNVFCFFWMQDTLSVKRNVFVSFVPKKQNVFSICQECCSIKCSNFVWNRRPACPIYTIYTNVLSLFVLTESFVGIEMSLFRLSGIMF